MMGSRILEALFVLCTWGHIGAAVFSPVQVPWQHDERYSDIHRSSDWCSIQKSIAKHSENISHAFKHALENKTVSVMLKYDPNHIWVNFNKTSGEIVGGYIPSVLDEVARRTGFRWRDSVAVVDPPNGSSQRDSYNRYLQWGVDTYDLVAGAFASTAERRGMGLRFGFPFLDSSPVLVGVFSKNGGYSNIWEQVFSWRRPFTRRLWILIVIAFVFTAMVYLILERDRDDFIADKMDHADHGQVSNFVGLHQFYHSFWMTVASFTGAGGFAPVGRFGKIFVASWTFSVLLLVSAYTANLATTLIVKESKTSSISSLQDAIAKKRPVCVYPGGAYDAFLADRYPDLPLIRPKDWGYHLVKDHRCAAMVKDGFFWRIDKGLKKYNSKCDLGIIGQPLLRVYSSFVGSDETVGCKALVLDVINAVMHDMYNDGWFDESEETFLGTVWDHSCSMDHSTSAEADALDIDSAGGIFATHAVVSVICLIGHRILVAVRAKSSYANLGEAGTSSPLQPNA